MRDIFARKLFHQNFRINPSLDLKPREDFKIGSLGLFQQTVMGCAFRDVDDDSAGFHKIKIRKSYNEDFVPYRYYVVIKDGYVVVYNSDLKSVRYYTHIEAKDLPEEDRIALIKGIYVNSEEELYSLLESYSS